MEVGYEKIAEKAGTPAFLFNRGKLEGNCRLFQKELKEVFKDSLVCYSVKTNSFEPALKTIAQMGFGFDVGSGSELEAALSCCPPEKTVFNGPCKRGEELRKAIESNILLINVDSFEEMEKIFGVQGSKKSVGIRVEFKKNKLGFVPSQVIKAFTEAYRLKLNPAALMAHPGTRVELNQYALFLKGVKKVYSEVKRNGFELDVLDLGGGFPCDEAKWRNYFELIEEEVGGTDFKLVLEPGRALVENAFSLLSKVHYLKEKNGMRYAILDAGINVLPRISLSKFSFKKIGVENEKNKQRFMLGGPLLFGNDQLGVMEADLKEGDLVLIENVGAYCYNLAWEISFPKPKTVEI
ncbi:hypothetical protein HY991_02875 [Candidatus Micrarchaeota archaeon]|nr:hypothetical protein [Candidatus Micrarchaeota archaeon]